MGTIKDILNTRVPGRLELWAALVIGAGSFPAGAVSSGFSVREQHREIARQPAGSIKAADLARARQNLQVHEWARRYLESLKRDANKWLPKLDEAFLERMIPDTTPGEALFTPCPACRALGKPYLPHGNWRWKPEAPDTLQCRACDTVFPNVEYPESVVIRSTWGKPQVFTFVGGKPFPVFSYLHGRPSMTGNIRARKVEWMATLADQWAQLYGLTGHLEYAKPVKSILLRFADVYPFWLLHVGYGEYADMDPVVAARQILDLPSDELVYPPNKPDRKLHTGYWTAGRAGAVGLEGRWVRSLVRAYDFTSGAQAEDGGSLYSASERVHIERDLLVESAHLLKADAAINNKSIGNHGAAALVGMVTGEPALVRFGINGFEKTVNQWFLPDGSMPESPCYTIFALEGILDLGQALRGYSDPPGYRDAEGSRIDRYDPYHQTLYKLVWEGMFKALQGDLFYPPFADSFRITHLDPKMLELMVANYPEKKEYLSLLAASLKGDWSKAYAPYAIYYAEPNRDKVPVPELKLPGYCSPDLRIGFMRTGHDGRESLLTLSASHWGIHHHKDSLNLYYWKNGEELLSDLGYLWDHPDKEKTERTMAHNTLLIDQKEQITHGRGGTVEYFIDSQHVKAMRASSGAYPAATRYERAATLVDHGNGNNYVVDLFWVEGGEVHDFIYHGPNSNVTAEAHSVSIPASTARPSLWTKMLAMFRRPVERNTPLLASASIPALYDLENLREIASREGAPYVLRWKTEGGMILSAWNLAGKNEVAYIGDGWGQRDSKNKDRGETLSYVVRRTTGPGLHTRVSLFEGHKEGVEAFVRNVALLPVSVGGAEATVLQVDTSVSRDYIVLSASPEAMTVRTREGQLQTDCRLCVVSTEGGRVKFSATDQGSIIWTPTLRSEADKEGERAGKGDRGAATGFLFPEIPTNLQPSLAGSAASRF